MAARQLPIRLSDALRARLDAEAERLNISVNAVVVVLLDRHLPPLPGDSRPAPTPPAASPSPADDDVADFE